MAADLAACTHHGGANEKGLCKRSGWPSLVCCVFRNLGRRAGGWTLEETDPTLGLGASPLRALFNIRGGSVPNGKWFSRMESLATGVWSEAWDYCICWGLKGAHRHLSTQQSWVLLQ